MSRETGQEQVTGDTSLPKVEEHSDTPGSSALSGESCGFYQVRTGLELETQGRVLNWNSNCKSFHRDGVRCSVVNVQGGLMFPWEKAEPGMCRTGLGSFLPQPWLERLVSVNPAGRGLISV